MRLASSLLSLCAALMLSGAATARDALVLANIQPRESSHAGRVLSLICRDAFGRLGMDVELRLTPPLRASIEADAGNIDGEVGRAIGYGQSHPGLIRVDEALASIKVVAFARTPGLAVNGWDSLKGKPYRVEYRSGYVTFKTRLEQLLPPQQISSVVDAQVGLQRVALGRTDLFIDTEEYGLSQLSRLQSRYGALYLAGLIEDIPVYIYLHRRHAALVPLLESTLTKMKADGALGRHRETAAGEERADTPPP